MLSTKLFTSGLCLTIAIASAPILAQDDSTGLSSNQSKKVYSPYVNRDYPQNVYWGESHLHTSYSWGQS